MCGTRGVNRELPAPFSQTTATINRQSYLSKAIVRYLNYLGCPTQLFNAGNVRRDMNLAGKDASFFDGNNAEAKALRERMAMMCLDQCLHYVVAHGPSGCRVAILDATNTTRERRRHVLERCRQEAESIRVLYLESLADDAELLEQNYRMKLSNGDYQGQDPQQALADFRDRVAKYEAVYEPITDAEATEHDFSYIQLYNAGQKMISRGVEGFVMRKIQRLMGSVHLRARTMWIVLTAETEYCQRGILGGDPYLSDEGMEYSQAVADLIHERQQCVSKEDLKEGHKELPITIYTGTRKAYLSVAQHVMTGVQAETVLLTLGYANDICAGLMDSRSACEREAQFPRECEARRADKLNYRYPGVGGESYVDVVARVNELTCLLEQSRGNSVVICDHAVYRCIKGYFLGYLIHEIPT